MKDLQSNYAVDFKISIWRKEKNQDQMIYSCDVDLQKLEEVQSSYHVKKVYILICILLIIFPWKISNLSCKRLNAMYFSSKDSVFTIPSEIENQSKVIVRFLKCF